MTRVSSLRRVRSLLFVVVVMACGQSVVQAFSPMASSISRIGTRKKASALFLSDIPEQPPRRNKNKNKNQENNNKKAEIKSSFAWQLPAAPEDQLVLSGDLLGLFVYGYICHDVAQHILFDQLDSFTKLHDAAMGSAQQLSVPVWLDTTTVSPTEQVHVLQMTLEPQLVAHYSFWLEPAGLAVTLLATSWLVAGYWQGAFLFHNTLHCRTETALRKTATTWVISSLLLLGVVGLSNYYFTAGGGAITYDYYYWTLGDIDYIIGSLTVLSVWRFLANWMLGTGQDR